MRRTILFILLAIALLVLAVVGPKATANMLSPKIEKAQTYYETHYEQRLR